jgi:hypothetical protein
MGRPKRELKKIHRKKVKKAKAKVKLYAKGEIPYEKLTQRAKSFLRKGKKKKSALA